MRIGIFGGTFNPIHFGHLVLAEQAYEKLSLDKVIFVPSFHPPHKNGPDIVSPANRFNMVRLAIKGNPRFEISDIEIKRKGCSYLVDTLRELRKLYPRAELFFISGSDVSEQITKWKSIRQIMSLSKFVLAKRPGYRLKTHSRHISVISITELDISSSVIRRKIRDGKSIRYLMPMRVYKYIRKKGFYR